MKFWSEWHFVENKMDIMQYIFKIQWICVLHKYTK
jgi:hypothetical protein